MAMTADQLAQQKKQAEELLFSGPQSLGFAKALYFGHFQAKGLFPYPVLPPDLARVRDEKADELRRFANEHIDANAIDRNANIPESVVRGLAGLGVLGMTAPKEVGGQGFNQQQYCKIMDVLGGHCASTAVFVNAHHSIGIRALLLFGTAEQKERWLPGLIAGSQLAAFALTEPQAGSDAANVQTTATPTPDGRGYLLNGEKRYITNGGIAQVLTVMARTPVDGSDETRITALLVTPDMPGFEVVEARAEKCGIRGTATGRMRFRDMFVPKENVLGPVGKGLRVALTVLDFGRTTFGASCTGAARFCLHAAIRHAKERVQFKQQLAEFELVRKKIAFMAAHLFAMEAATTHCAALIDSGAEDFMLETAMLKVFATDHLWTIVNDTIQIYGGKAYFTDEPFERMMRDARINMIGEGANDVLRSFIALVGMRGVGEELMGVLEALKRPFTRGGTLWKFGLDQMSARLSNPEVPVKSRQLAGEARALARSVREFGLQVSWALRNAGKVEVLIKDQLTQERVADAATDLYAASCSLARLDHLLTHGNGNPADTAREVAAGRCFVKLALRRVRNNLAALHDNDDASLRSAADAFLGKAD
jgi:alkylation response protein AidB-like acyl-CoA dehydrogenase